MGKLIYASPMSLDGYLGDGNYDWSVPSEVATAFMTEVMRPVGTYLYGRKMYETMAVWEDPAFVSSVGLSDQEFARVWQAADKIIYSKSLNEVSTKKSRLEKNFDVNAIREMKSRIPTDISIGGANLAAQAIKAGLVDEYHLFVVPVTIGGGLSVLPKDHSIQLDLIEQCKFGEGWMFLRYQTHT